MPELIYAPETQGFATPEGPRAGGASFTPAVGQALQRVGEEGAQLANSLNRIEYMRDQYNQISEASKLNAQASNDFTAYQREMQAKYSDTDGAGMFDLMSKHIEDFTNAAADRFTNPRAKEVFAQHMAALQQHFGNNAINWEANQAQAFREANFDDALRQSVDAVSKDPTLYASSLATQLHALDNVPGDLNPLALPMKTRMKARAIDALSTAAGLASAQKFPQETVNAIRGTQPLPAGTPQAAIVREAKAAGISANTALAVASIENDTFDPVRKNPMSSATGLFQMIGSTWNQMGGTDADRGDTDAQARLGVKNLAQNTVALGKAIGRTPTPGETYSTQFGLEFAKALNKAAPGAPAVDVFGKAGFDDPVRAAAQNGMTNMTAGQVRAHFETLMAQRMQATAGYASADDATTPMPPPEWLKDMSGPQRQAILTHAEANLRRHEATGQSDLMQRANDWEAAMNRGEQSVAPRPDPATVLETLGPVKGAELNNRLDQAQTYGAAVAQLQTAGPQVQAQILQQAKVDLGAASPGSYGYATAQARYDSLVAAQRDIQNARIANPIGADQQSIRLTAPLDFSNPSFLTGPLAARYEQADTLRQMWALPDYKPLEAHEATALGEFFANGQPKEVAKYLAAARFAAGPERADRFGALMRQVAEKHPLIATAGMIAQYDQDAAAKILTGAGMLKDEKVLGVAANAQQFDAAWNTLRGTAFGSATETSRQTLDAAKAMYAVMLPPDRRNSKSVDTNLLEQIANRIAPVAQWNGPVLMPPGMTQDAFVRDVGARYGAALQRAGYDPKQWPMNLVGFVPDPTADGVYYPISGLTMLPARIDLNAPPDMTVLPAPEPSRLTPQQVVQRNRPTGQKSVYYRGK